MPQETAESLHDLLLMKLQSLYFTEQQLTKALPKMAEAATDPDLKQAFLSHLAETEEQVKRLETAFEELDERPEPLENDGILGLVQDAEWCIKNIENAQARDASLVAAAQFVEHYEMAGYGSAAAWAETMGHTEVKNLLGQTLDEEKMADEKLNGLALAKINDSANDMVEEESAGERGFMRNLQPGSV